MRVARNVSFLFLLVVLVSLPSRAKAEIWGDCYSGGEYGIDWGMEYGLGQESAVQNFCSLNDGSSCDSQCGACGRAGAGSADCEVYRYCAAGGGCGAGGDTVGCDCDCACQEELLPPE
jgi:hypothetical protein